jgi:hypothetical protein
MPSMFACNPFASSAGNSPASLQMPGYDGSMEKHMEQLTDWFIMIGTEPAVREVIVASFQAWRSCTPPPTTANFELQQVLQRQLALGWESAFEG